MINKIIAIDFEYCTDKGKDFGLDEPLKAHPFTKKLYCVSICENGVAHSWWLQNESQRLCFVNWFNSLDKTKTLFLAHFYELAEAQCLFTLGIDTRNILVFDTGYTYMVMNPLFLESGMLSEKCKLESICRDWLHIDIDHIEKVEMRNHCINDTTASHEQEIMTYCEHDVIHLEELYNEYRRRYSEFMINTISHRLTSFASDSPNDRVISFDEWVYNMAVDFQISQEIVRNGLPVNTEKLMKLREGLRSYISEYKEKFNNKFPGTFKRDKKTGEWKMSTKTVRELLEADLKEFGLLDKWPRSEKTNALEMSKEALSEHFDIREDPSFEDNDHIAHWLSYMKRFIDTEMAAISREDISKSWCKNLYNDRIYCYSVQPNKAKTQRWQGMPREGYIPQWHRPFRAVLNPPKGKILCECDFHSEETAIFAILFNDPKYVEQYMTDDPYIYNAIQMGLLPDGTKKSNMTKEQAKIRKKVKTFSLAWQYGSGYKSLARDLKIPESEAKDYKERLDKIYNASKTRQKYFVDEVSPKYVGRQGHGELKPHDTIMVLPDGYPIFISKDAKVKATTIGNQPIQSFGAYILRQCVRAVREAGLKMIATVHDAIWIEADSLEDCERLRSIMYNVATKCLRKKLLTVGEPFTIFNGEFKCEEQEDTEKFEYFTK